MKFINKLFLIIILGLILLIPKKINAQQDSQYTNYMYNTVSINPAYAGTRDALSIFGLHRTQWVGLVGAPVTNNVSSHSPIGESNIGLGLSFVNDRIGIADENTISADIAYRIKTSVNTTLSLGIKTTANLLNINYTKLNIKDASDLEFQNNIDNRFSPNFGAGAYWYSDKYYLGLSVPNILETKHYNDNNKNSLAKEKMHFYFTGGYVFDLNQSIKFKPAFITKLVQGAPLAIDVSANFLFNEKFTLGAAYRLDVAASLLAGFQITSNLMVGYGYDMETTKLANYNSGSHEIFLRFEITKKLQKLITPRFF